MSNQFSKIYETAKALREGDEGKQKNVVLSICRKAGNIDEVLNRGEKSMTRIERVLIIPNNRFEEFIVYGDYFSRDFNEIYDIKHLRDWSEIRDEDEVYPPFYIDSQGFDYMRYTAIAEKDKRAWRDALK